MDKIFKIWVFALSIACLVCIFHQPLLSASELSEEEIETTEKEEVELSISELSEEEVMYAVLLSRKYSVPEKTIYRLLIEYSSVDPESLCASYGEPESIATCYKAQLDELSKHLNIPEETLGSMILDCKLLTLMAHGRRSKLDKYFNIDAK